MALYYVMLIHQSLNYGIFKETLILCIICCLHVSVKTSLQMLIHNRKKKNNDMD